MAKTYSVYNGPMVTTAAPVKVTTGTAIKTMLQIRAASNNALRIVEWGISFDGTTAATPGVVELLTTGTVGATITAYVAADIYSHNDPNSTASLIQIGSTTNSGYSASAEGTITTTRELDVQLIDPVNQYVKQFPLNREPEVATNTYCRIRVTFGTAVNCICYLIWEE